MGIKKNFLFSTVLTVSNYIFPFIVYPYVARVLGVDNIGICNFVDSVVNYAIMLSMMGLTVIGVRDIAKAKGNRRQLDITFTSLFVTCAVFTLLSTAALVIATFTIPNLAPYRKLLAIGVVKLWSNFLLIDWLYRGLEDFKYITIRTILVKFAYIVSVFIFVRKSSDYQVYYLLLCLMVTVNAAFNFSKAFSLVRFRIDISSIKGVLRPFVILGVYIFLNSMYTNFNVIYLEANWGTTEVGYYTTATKIFNLILGVYTAYSGVVMPRASALISEHKLDEFRELIGKSMDALILISVPAVIFTMVFTPGIIYLVVGSQYIGSIFPMMIVMPLIFIIGYEQILVVQILTPMATDKIILFNSIVGATVGITANILLVGEFAAVGSSMVWLASEISVLLCAQFFVTRRTGIQFPARTLLRNIIMYMPYLVLAMAFVYFFEINPIVQMIIGAVAIIPYFFLVQRYVLKNSVFSGLYEASIRRFSTF